jgi:heme peroxidase
MSTVQPSPVAPMNHRVDDRMETFAEKTRERKSPKSGMFGWLFPDLRAFRADPKDLIELGTAMLERNGQKDQGSKSNIPAGFTFLGQFVAHDITFDTTPFPERVEDTTATENYRTPALDLDCVYGNGPLAHRFLYRRSDHKSFVIGENLRAKPNREFPYVDDDLPRNDENVAIIADPRNDENLIVSQLHVAMMYFHNQVVTTQPDWEFDCVRKHVTLHYQWILLNDFLARLVDAEVLRDVLKNGPKFYKPKKFAFIPVEFSAAAYRFGHSTVRESYSYNDSVKKVQLFQLFLFTGALGVARASIPVPSNWLIDWHRFFFEQSEVAHPNQNFARKISPMLSPMMGDLPKDLVPAIGLPFVKHADNQNLAVRNLLRGNGFGLPSGQSVAKEMKKRGLPVQVLQPGDIGKGHDGEVAARLKFDKETPLWYYILKEAHLKAKGEKLGPVGSRILAEVFVGLLRCPGALLNKEYKGWSPTLGQTAGQFTMLDLLEVAGQLNRRG